MIKKDETNQGTEKKYKEKAVNNMTNKSVCVCVCVCINVLLLPKMELCACSVMSDSGTPGIVVTRLLCPWNFSGKNTGMGCHFLFQRIFLTQGSNLHLQYLLHCRQILYQLSQMGNPDYGLTTLITHLFHNPLKLNI